MSKDDDSSELAGSFKAAASLGGTVEEQKVVAHHSSLPRIVNRRYMIDSVVTHLWIQIFNDCVVFGVSQLPQGRVGNFILCQPELDLNDAANAAASAVARPGSMAYQLTHLLGSRDDPLLDVYARRLWEFLGASASSIPSIVLGISLQKETKKPAVFHKIIELLVKLYQEALTTV